MLGLQQDVGTGSPARTKAASTPRAESKGSKILELIWACPIRVSGRHEISQARSDAAPKKAAISGVIGSRKEERACFRDRDSPNISFTANVRAAVRVLPDATKEHGKRYA
jgi:hypothetical protein